MTLPRAILENLAYPAIFFAVIWGIGGCRTTTPQCRPPTGRPDQRAERNPYNPPVLVTNALPAPPLPSLKANAVRSAVTQVIAVRKPVPISLSWDAPASPVDHYLLYLSHGNQQWYKVLNVGTNTTVNLSNYMAPLEFQVVAVNLNGYFSPPSAEAYYGVKSNGWPMSVNGIPQFVFTAESTSVYTMSNSPLTTTHWTNLATISNRSGLVLVPLPGMTGRVSWQAAR